MQNKITDLIFLNLPEEVFIRMGSKGSGNWGHKGRPGKRGGSAPGGGKGAAGSGDFVTSSFEGIKITAHADVHDDLARQLMMFPPEHLRGLTEVSTQGKLTYKDDGEHFYQRNREGKYNGVYFGKTGSIIIHRNAVNRNTLTHEIGHHIARKSPGWSLGAKRIAKNIAIDVASGKLANFRELGLRRNSFRNSSEFLADTYKVWLHGDMQEWLKLSNEVKRHGGERFDLERLFGTKEPM